MPVVAIAPARHDPHQRTPAPLVERARAGEFVAADRTAALPPADLDRRLFEAVSRTPRADPEGANAGLAAKAVHAYLLAGTPANVTTGRRIDGYA